jgi:ABC-type tungstate transport system permease subunit
VSSKPTCKLREESKSNVALPPAILTGQNTNAISVDQSIACASPEFIKEGGSESRTNWELNHYISQIDKADIAELKSIKKSNESLDLIINTVCLLMGTK